MVTCDKCRGTHKCQSCGGTGIGVLGTVSNLQGDTACEILKLPSLNPCKVCGGTGECQTCMEDLLAVRN